MSIPKPLVQVNQSFIVITVLLAFVIHPIILLLPFLNGLYTLITKKNPLIMFSRRFLTKPMNQYRQEDRDQQIFNQWIATICIGLSLVFFYLHFTTVGIIFSLMVLAASGIALMGYCIGCTIRYRYMKWRYNRT
ncbi:DUF4395 domain-containing protein [Oceanobacillus longus]|uniref:DUF4395 domain-containing protein n=1 Tax=Oceanobacillus longus TaxID=930120 RepID=A0ABV8GU85_9BACI